MGFGSRRLACGATETEQGRDSDGIEPRREDLPTPGLQPSSSGARGQPAELGYVVPRRWLCGRPRRYTSEPGVSAEGQRPTDIRVQRVVPVTEQDAANAGALAAKQGLFRQRAVPVALPRLRECDRHGYVVATARSHAAVRRLQDQRQQADGLHDREVSRPCTTLDEISSKSRAMPSSA